MKKLILLCILFAGISIGSSAQPGSMGNLDPNAPVLVIDKKEFDFGTIKQGEKTTYKLSFKNSGKSPLIISNIITPCGCTAPEWPKEPIAPGKSAIITIVFNSAGKSGMQNKPLTIQSNNKEGDLVFTLKGNVEVPKQTGTIMPTDKKEGPVEKKD